MQAIAMDASSMVGTAGFFRVGKSTTGRWWLVRPDGKPMFYRGVCALWMPDDDKGLEAVEFRRNWEKENGKDTEMFAAHCFGILADRGFNAFGEWSTRQFWNRGWPFTVLLHVREVRSESNVNDTLPDIFDPAWRDRSLGTAPACVHGFGEEVNLRTPARHACCEG